MADVAIMEYKTSSKDLYLVSCGWEKCPRIWGKNYQVGRK